MQKRREKKIPENKNPAQRLVYSALDRKLHSNFFRYAVLLPLVELVFSPRICRFFIAVYGRKTHTTRKRHPPFCY